ncbi:MAG: (d)CMP kinase [Lachnospiraceae bacterium]|nr:(d)CMP kinase [Lachnospiraceae bacterium]
MEENAERTVNIAIDGPAGAGKSTIARAIARRKGYIYVDTGAMFRAMAIYLIRKGTDGDDEEAISRDCAGADITISYRPAEGSHTPEQRVLLCGEDVTDGLRTEEVGNMVSKCSVVPAVRDKLKELQRELARKENVVMDGRDIGTVILPDAQVKIYLTASVGVRAKRRYDELTARGEEADLSVIAAQIQERDRRDMTRPVAPLTQAEDAILVDTSDMTIEEVTERILSIIRNTVI